METNRGIDAFYRSKVSGLTYLELHKELLPFKYVWDTVVLHLLVPMKRLPSLNHKPRKTTYKTAKRFSAKRNRR